ncbi:MAG: hypothetical protein PHY28_01955 [Dehalococcoidales bacterium]|nr:hypothetical protein [Dehalococcoidales bacterium]
MKYCRIIISTIILILTAIALLPGAFVSAAPTISVTPTTGVSGTRVTVSGSSFSSYSGDQLSVYFDDTRVIPDKITTSGIGIFQTTFMVPDVTLSGAHIVSVRRETGAVLAESQFYVPAPGIILNKWGGVVGTTIDILCKGFYANAEISIQYYPTDTGETLATQATNDAGECAVQLIIPASSTGNHKIVAKNDKGNSAQADFEVTPSLSINPATGAVGDKVDISGSGFIGNSEIGVTLHGNRVAFARVSERGSFDAIFYVPVIKAGTYAIEIEDSARAKRWIDFTIDSRITLSKSAGEAGMKLTVNGTGFEVGGIVTVKYDAAEISWLVADSNGSFSFSFDVPTGIAGSHIVTASDGLNTRQKVFTVESEAPPAPKPIVPKRDSMVGAQVSFDWESVYDPSEPVAYTLQIARDDDFFSPILVKKALSLSQYVLTTEEALLPSRRFTHYYWRVRATDSASNAGEWSEPIKFQVEPSNTLPDWAKYVLGAVGVLLIVLLVFRIRKATRRTEKKPGKA